MPYKHIYNCADTHIVSIRSFAGFQVTFDQLNFDVMHTDLWVIDSVIEGAAQVHMHKWLCWHTCTFVHAFAQGACLSACVCACVRACMCACGFVCVRSAV